MVRLFILAILLCSLGCGSSQVDGQTPGERLDPKAQPSISETAKKVPATPEQVKVVLDLEEYPEALIVSNERLVDAGMSPDETRFVLVRKSKDAPEKVAKFFESKLSAIASGSGSHRELFGRTQRGNDVRVKVDASGTGSTYTLSVICYTK